MSIIEKIDSIVNSIQQRIDWDEYFMSLALLASSRSSCKRLKVGCVAVKNTRIIAMGYNGINQYVIDRITHQEREKLLVDNGGLSYQEWIEKEIDRFLKNPSLLFRQYSCIFENLFPEVVRLKPAVFIKSFQQLDLSLMAELIFGKNAKLEIFTEDETRINYIQEIPLSMETYWN